MDVRITSTGKIFYQVDPTLCAILTEMFPAAIERVKPQPAPAAPVAPKWGITIGAITGDYWIQGSCNKCSQVFRVATGTEAQIRAQRFSHCGQNEPIPEHVIAEFIRVRPAQAAMPTAYYQAALSKDIKPPAGDSK